MRSRLSAFVLLSAMLSVAAPSPAAAQTTTATQTVVAAQTTADAESAAATAPFTPTLNFGGYIQAELDAGAQGDSRFPAPNRILLRRARLTASGKVTPWLEYKLQGDFAGGLSAATSVRAQLTDGYVEWTKFSAAHIRIGQFKAGFGNEWLTPSTQLITVERTLATDRLTLNRQIGAQVSGDLLQKRLSYSAGLFNGNGRNTTTNDDGKFLYTARASALVWRGAHAGTLHVGADGYWGTEKQLSEPADFGLDSTPATPAVDNLFTGTGHGLGFDAQFVRGIWRVDAEFLRDRFIQDNSVPQPDVVSRGWYVMPAAFVYQRTVQVVGRYEQFVPNVSIGTDTDRTREWLGGVDYYIRGANKLMVDYLWVDAPTDPGQHQKVLAEIQVVF